MLNLAVRNSKKLIRERSAEDNVRIGRFFTKRDTARLMAGAFTYVQKNAVYVLDPGAGTGILSAAAVEEICRHGGVREIFLVCYEINPLFLPRLTDNLERIRKKARHDYRVKLRPTVLEQDFLLSPHAEDERYDYILINPPTEPVDASMPEVTLFPGVFSAATVNRAYLFTTMAARLLAPDGQMAVILPTSVASSVSLERFRRDLFGMAHPEAVCLFAGGKREPLRKNLILLLREGKVPPADVRVSVSDDDGTPAATHILAPVPYRTFVSEKDASLLLQNDAGESALLDFIRALPATFATYHLKVHTGLTLVSRYPDLLRDRHEDGAIPLIYPRCLHDGTVTFPLSGVPRQYIIPALPSLRQPSKNIILIKRVPAKSDKRRLMCAAFLAGSMMYKYISTHNKLNYIDVDGKEQMDAPFLYGLLGYLSSEPVDRYFRIVSKSAQVNATELADLPLPDAVTLRAIGAKLMAVRVYKPEYCDRVVRAVLSPTN